jgi:hypothetical protein
MQYTNIHAHKSVLIHKDLIPNIFCNSVRLIYQKLKENKSFFDFVVQAGGFKWNTCM